MPSDIHTTPRDMPSDIHTTHSLGICGIGYFHRIQVLIRQSSTFRIAAA